jgi:hypothetical protein
LTVSISSSPSMMRSAFDEGGAFFVDEFIDVVREGAHSGEESHLVRRPFHNTWLVFSGGLHSSSRGLALECSVGDVVAHISLASRRALKNQGG